MKIFYENCSGFFQRHLSFTWIAIALLLFLPLLLQSCASTDHSTSITSPATLEQPNRPLNKHEIHEAPAHFTAGNLPLGIGAKFDFFVTDSAESVQEVYSSVIRPIRSGKIMSRTPVALDYSIFPSSGAAFEHDGGLDNKTIKSNYKFQVGMSRKFNRFTDLFTTDFWLAKGEFNPSSQKAYVNTDDQVKLFDEEDHLILSPESMQAIRWEQYLGQGWEENDPLTNTSITRIE